MEAVEAKMTLESHHHYKIHADHKVKPEQVVSHQKKQQQTSYLYFAWSIIVHHRLLTLKFVCGNARPSCIDARPLRFFSSSLPRVSCAVYRSMRNLNWVCAYFCQIVDSSSTVPTVVSKWHCSWWGGIFVAQCAIDRGRGTNFRWSTPCQSSSWLVRLSTA